MGRLHRAQVLLDPAQYRRLRRIAARRSLEEGRRVSVSQVIRELLDQPWKRRKALKNEPGRLLSGFSCWGTPSGSVTRSFCPKTG